MLKFLSFLVFVFASFQCLSQCSTVVVQISSSDTSYVQLYQAGFFNIPSGFDNVVEWEVTDFAGELIHEDETSGSSTDQSTTLFDHEVSIEDSMKVTIVITNETEGIICTMNDTLIWEETEVIPGSFIGNWSVLSSNGGVEEEIITSIHSIEEDVDFKIIPSLVHRQFRIEGDFENFSLHILNANGELVLNQKNIKHHEEIDIAHLQAGIYFIKLFDNKNRFLEKSKKIVKL